MSEQVWRAGRGPDVGRVRRFDEVRWKERCSVYLRSLRLFLLMSRC